MAELTVYPDANPESTTVDGRAMDTTSAAWATIRAAAGDAAEDSTNPAYVVSLDGGASPNYVYFTRGMLLFDASAIPVSATITSVVFGLYVTAKQDNHGGMSVNIVASSPASNTALAASDFASAFTLNSDTKFSTAKTIASISTSAYSDWTLNASGIAHVQTAIESDGIVKLGVRFEEDIDNSAPTWNAGVSGIQTYFSEQGSNKPRLVINYKLPSGFLALL